MIYRLSTDYSIQHGLFGVRLARYDARSHGSEFLKWNWGTVERGVQIPDDAVAYLEEFEMKAFLQAALDAAWAMGLKPAGMNEDKPELSAVRYHLEDMRKLVLK